MTINRTALTDRQPNDFATIDDINDAYAAINDLKFNAADGSVSDIEVNRGSAEANDRGVKFWLTATTWVRFFWDQTNEIFRLVNNSGAAQKLAIANGTASTHAVTKGQLDAAIAALQLEVVGAIKLYAGTTAPTGYLLCDGTAVSRTTYAALFAICSTAFGAGDGSTTFNLPDLRGRVALGLDNMGGVTAGRITSASLNGGNAITRGGTGGAETHILTLAQMPAHTHTYNGGTANAGNNGTVNAGSTAPTSQTTGSAGSGNAHNNTQPWLALNYIIKT